MATSLPATRRAIVPRFPWAPVAILVGLSLATAAGCGSFAAQGRNAEGVRMFQQARYQEAIQQFHLAINADPHNPDGYYNMAAVYHRLGTVESNSPDLKQAEHYYLMCRDRDPDHAECYRGLAVLMVQQGRSEEAFRLIEDWGTRQPTLAEPKIELARLHQEFGDLKAAREHLLEALAVAPQNAVAMTALGNVREQLGETTQAMEIYQRSLALNRFQPDVMARMAALQSGHSVQPVVTAPTATSSGETQIAAGAAPIRR